MSTRLTIHGLHFWVDKQGFNPGLVAQQGGEEAVSNLEDIMLSMKPEAIATLHRLLASDDEHEATQDGLDWADDLATRAMPTWATWHNPDGAGLSLSAQLERIAAPDEANEDQGSTK